MSYVIHFSNFLFSQIDINSLIAIFLPISKDYGQNLWKVQPFFLSLQHK